MRRASIDHIVGGIYPISLWSPSAGLTFNQFLIDDEAPTLVHTGRYDDAREGSGTATRSTWARTSFASSRRRTCITGIR